MFAKISELPERWRLLLAGAAAIPLVVLIYPFKTTVVPRWRLHVVDGTGTFVREIKVTEHWQHYLLESAGHEEILRTDDAGMVDFPERTIRASLLSRAVGTIGNFVRAGAKGRFGPYASIVVWGSAEYEAAVAVYEPEKPPQNQIVIHRQ